MTATIKPPGRERRPRQRAPRFSSMESLGFSDSTHVWSDSPSGPPGAAHRTVEPLADPFSDWVPADVGHLGGRSFRWSMLLTALLLIGAIAGAGWWLYQRPATQAAATASEIDDAAVDLETALPVVEGLNAELLTADETTDMSTLDEVDAAARHLFNSSSALTDSVGRSAAAAASSAALDSVRLLRDAHAYRMAVTPMLTAPSLETDPELIALDDAARSFGDWQLAFDQVRMALPDDVLSAMTQDFELISSQLPSVLTSYVDALREDDQAKADVVLGELSELLSQAAQSLNDAMVETQERVATRIVESRAALTELSG